MDKKLTFYCDLKSVISYSLKGYKSVYMIMLILFNIIHYLMIKYGMNQVNCLYHVGLVHLISLYGIDLCISQGLH